MFFNNKLQKWLLSPSNCDTDFLSLQISAESSSYIHKQMLLVIMIVLRTRTSKYKNYLTHYGCLYSNSKAVILYNSGSQTLVHIPLMVPGLPLVVCKVLWFPLGLRHNLIHLIYIMTLVIGKRCSQSDRWVHSENGNEQVNKWGEAWVHGPTWGGSREQVEEDVERR